MDVGLAVRCVEFGVYQVFVERSVGWDGIGGRLPGGKCGNFVVADCGIDGGLHRNWCGEWEHEGGGVS